MENLNKVTTERILKARVELIQAHRFYGVLCSNIVPVLTDKVETAATDTKRHYFNPKFVETLSQDELLGTQVHENEHDARHHSTRRMGRDPEEWNISCDLAIDQDIIAQGYTLPTVHLDWLKGQWKEDYRGKSAEDIFRIRELDRAKQQQQQPQPEVDESEDGKQSNDDEQSSGESEPSDDQGNGKEADADETGEGDQGEGSGESKAEGDTDNAESDEGNGGDGKAEGKPNGDATGSGNGAEGEANENIPPQAPGAPSRGCGEVLDAAKDIGSLSEEDTKWERIVRQAASMAKAAGQLPGHVSRDIERANNPPKDWRDELRRFFDSGALVRETWNKPNRRFAGSGLILPGSQKDGINKAVFLIDTSGSMDEIALKAVRNEAQAALDDGVIDEVVVVYGDVTVNRVDEYRTGDEIEFDPRGGGGTDMEPMFKYVEENVNSPSLIVNFTDLEFYKSCGPEPAVPTLFAVTGYPDRVRQLMAVAPWNAPCIDVGAH